MKPLSHAMKFALACFVLSVAAATADDKPLPTETHDGLVLREGKVAKIVYVRPGVDFSQYKRIALLDCFVAFRKDWQKDHDDPGKRVTQKDMDAIRAGLAEEFRKVFTEELTKGGYQVVTEGGADVLVLRPAIIDLDVSAPDTMQAGRSYTLSESSGAMTLYVELLDSLTNQILARAADRRADRGTGQITWQTRVSNVAEADRMLRRWAKALRERLDEVHGRGKP